MADIQLISLVYLHFGLQNSIRNRLIFRGYILIVLAVSYMKMLFLFWIEIIFTYAQYKCLIQTSSSKGCFIEVNFDATSLVF